MKNHIQLSVVKRLILSLTLLCFVFQAHAATITFALTNSLGQPDTNVIRGFPLVAYPNADGSWTTAGLPFRITPTNGIASINLAAGNYLLTNSTLVSPSYVNPSGFGTQQGVIIAVPSANGTYPFGLLAISGYNTYNYNGSTAFGNTNTSTVGQGTNVVIQTNSNSYTVQVPNQSFLTNGLPSKLDVTNIVNAITTNNPAGYISSDATNKIWAVLPQTNGFGNIVYSNASSFVTPVSLIDATNRDYAAWLTAVQGTNAALTSALNTASNLLQFQKQPANAFFTNLLGTGAWTNSLVAGNGLSLSTNLGVVTATVTFSTNGLATTNFVTNAISAAINMATNGFVLASITNGLATTNYVNSATNGFVLSSITNGLATTNYVNTSTNTIGISSGLMAFQLTNAWATYNALTNYITITSNGITAGTGISASTATNIIQNFIMGGVITNQTTNTAFSSFGSNSIISIAQSVILSSNLWSTTGNKLPTGSALTTNVVGYVNTGATEDAPIFFNIHGQPAMELGVWYPGGAGINTSYAPDFLLNPSDAFGGRNTTVPTLPNRIGGTTFNLFPFGTSILGGRSNVVWQSTALMSDNTQAGLWFSENSILGGFGNSITNASLSVAGGYYATVMAGHNGSFVWSDSSAPSRFSTTGSNQFLIRSVGGVAINTNNANGYSLFVNGSINATNMYVNGVAVATTSSAGSVGGLTNITVATNGTVYTVAVPTQSFLTNGFTTMVYSNPANMATVAYVNSVGLGTTNLTYLVGQGGTNLSYLIGQAGTNLFNQSGVNLTNISSTISNNLLNFVQSTSGTAFYPTLKSNITLNYFPWLYTTTNVLGINGAGVVPANGTYLQISVGTWTNIIGNGSDVIFQNPTYYLRTNLVNLYSTSNLFFNSTWVNVVGSTAVPTNSGFGYIANHNGQWDTNIWAQGLIGIVPMTSLDTTKVVTNNSSPNFNNVAVGNLTVNGFQTNNTSVYFHGNIVGGKYFGDGFGLTNLNLSITNGGGSIFNTTVIGNQGFLASSNVAFGSSATWFGAHSYNSQDTILSLPTTGSGGITNGGLILWPEAGGGITVANSDGSATLMRIDDITNQATGLVYTGQVTANKFIASQFAGTFTGTVVATNGNVVTNFQQSLRWPDEIDIISGTSMDCQLYASNSGAAFNYNWSVHGGGPLASTVAYGITNGIYYYSNGLPYQSNNVCVWDYVTNGIQLRFGANVQLQNYDAVPGGCLGDEAFGYPASQSVDGLIKNPSQYPGAKYRPPFYFQQGGATITPPYIYSARNSPLMTQKFKWAIVGFPQNDVISITNFADIHRNLTNVWNLLRQDGYVVIQKTGTIGVNFYTNSDPTKGLTVSGIEVTNIANDIITNQIQPDFVLNVFSLSSTNSSYQIDGTHNAIFFQTNIEAPYIVSSLSSNLASLQKSQTTWPAQTMTVWPNTTGLSYSVVNTNNINVWAVSNLLAFHTYSLISPEISMQEGSGALGGIRWDMYLDGTGLYNYTTYVIFFNCDAGTKVYDWFTSAGNSLVASRGLNIVGLNQYNWGLEGLSSQFMVGATNCNFFFQMNPYTNAASTIKINNGGDARIQLIQ